MSRSASSLQHTIKAVIRPGNESSFLAECVEIAVVTQGETLDAVTANLREAVGLHLDGEDLAVLGLAPNPTLVVTMELEPVYASAGYFIPRAEFGSFRRKNSI